MTTNLCVFISKFIYEKENEFVFEHFDDNKRKTNTLFEICVIFEKKNQIPSRQCVYLSRVFSTRSNATNVIEIKVEEK